MTPATISNLIDRLEKGGMVQWVGPGESSGGRKPQLLQFKSDAFYLMGVDIGLAKILAIISDLHGNIIAECRVEITESDDTESIIARLESVITNLLEGGAVPRERIRGIGVSRDAPKFAIAEFGENANSIGAAALALERVLAL